MSITINTQRYQVNRHSDFELSMSVLKDGEAYAPSQFVMVFYIDDWDDCETMYKASLINGEFKNCSLNGNTITVYFDSPRFDLGTLKCRFYDKVINSSFADGSFDTCTPIVLPIDIVAGAGNMHNIDVGEVSVVGAGVEVDSELSSTSENPVQNKVITNALAGYYGREDVDAKLVFKADINGNPYNPFGALEFKLFSQGEAEELVKANATVDHQDESVTITFSDAYNNGYDKLSYTFDSLDQRERHIATKEFVEEYVSEYGGDEQVQADWDEDDTTDPAYIKNKPTIPAAQVQSDWNATSGMGVILNKPTIPDVSTLATKTELNGKQDKINDLASIRINSGKGVADMSSNADGTVVYTLANGDTYTIDLNHEHPQYVESDDLADVALSGSYNDLTDKPVIPEGADLSGYYTKTEIDNKGFITTETDPTVPSWAKQSSKPTYTAQEVGALPASTTIPTKVSDLTNDSGFITSYTETDPTVPAWAKSATKPSYTASEVGAVPTTRKVNGKALSADISLGAGDVGALPSNTHIPADQVQSNWNETNTSSKAYIQNKPTIPAAQVNADWNATSGVSRILNKPTIPTVPTNVSSLTNDAGYLTQHQSLANYYTKSEIDTKIGNIETLLASI